jgi:hypothetical protein
VLIVECIGVHITVLQLPESMEDERAALGDDAFLAMRQAWRNT